MSSRERWVRATVRCTTCALPVPVEALDAAVACPSCGAAATLEWTWWREALEAADEESAFQREGSTLDAAQPARLGPAQAVPGFIAQHVPSLRAWALEDAVHAPAAPERLACPGCGANLDVDASAERTTQCRYCSASVLLPEAIWAKLHPVRPPRVLWLRYEGATPREQMRAAERAIELRLRKDELEAKLRGPGAWLGPLASNAILAIFTARIAHAWTVGFDGWLAWAAAYALAFLLGAPFIVALALWIRGRRRRLVREIETEQRALE